LAARLRRLSSESVRLQCLPSGARTSGYTRDADIHGCVFGSRFGRNERRKRSNELRKIFGNDLPDNVLVHAEIVVHDFVSHPDDVLPRNLGMTGGEFAGNVTRGLADHLNEVSEGEPKVFVCVVAVT
jgi:hypothetical protein